MQVNVKRTGVTATVRPVPTDNTLAVLPMTPDRVGKDPDEKIREGAVSVQSLDEAFEKFKPELDFKHTVDDTEFKAELKFESLRDFDPDTLLTRKPGQRNDIADLQGRIEMLQQLRTRVAQTKVKKAWANEQQREQLIDAVKQFQTQISRIASGEIGGE